MNISYSDVCQLLCYIITSEIQANTLSSFLSNWTWEHLCFCYFYTSGIKIADCLLTNVYVLIKLASAIPEKDIEMQYVIFYLNVHFNECIVYLKIFQVDSCTYSKTEESPEVRQPLYLVEFS